MSEHFEKFKCKKDFTLKSLREVEHFLRCFTLIKKGKKAYDVFKR